MLLNLMISFNGCLTTFKWLCIMQQCKTTLLCFIIVIQSVAFCVVAMMHRVREPLCEPNFLCIFVFRITSRPREKFVDSKRSLNSSVVHVTDRSKAIVPVLFFFSVALWL